MNPTNSTNPMNLWGRHTAVLGALLICQSLVSGVMAGAVLLDKIVAVVNADVLTLLDFEDHLALSQMFRHDPVGAMGEFPRRDREPALQRFIDHTLMRQEALRTKIVEVAEGEVTQQLQAVEQRPDGREELGQLMRERGLSQSQVRTWLRHQLIVRAFIDRRVRLFVRVSDSDITQYYQAHQQAIGQPVSDPIRQQIRSLLVEQRVNVRIAPLVEELRKKANLHFPP